MNKKNIKLIMELIFIFILPLVFICFTSENQVEREFSYDNNGNYETSQETKNLSFDNSIIKYKKDSTIIEYSMEINYFEKKSYPYLQVYFKESDLLNELTIFYLTQASDEEELGLYLQSNYTIFLYGVDHTTDTEFLNEEIEYNEIIEQNNIIYYGFYINKYIDIYEDAEFIENLGYYTNTQENEVIVQVNTIWGNIKQLLIDNLDLNDNVLLDIILCYTILWVIMFLIWHLLYGMFELIVHIIPRRE